MLAAILARAQPVIGYIEQNYAFGGAVRDLWRLLVPAGGGGVTAYFAAATEWLDAYGPIAWIAAFWVGLLATVLALLGIATLWLQWEKARYTNSLSSRVMSVNPLDTFFERQRIRLMDFYTFPPSVYDAGTFVDCHIFGPVNVLLMGSVRFENVSMNAITEFVRVKSDATVMNAIHLKYPVFRRCTLYNVTVLIPDSVTDKVLPPHLNWITEPLDPSHPAE